MAFIHRLTFALGLVFAYFTPNLYLVLKLQGYHNTVYNHSPGPCKKVSEIVYGAEDLEFLSNGVAIISSGMRFMAAETNPNYAEYEGAMYLLDMEKPEPSAVKLSITGDLDMSAFNPHGISIHEHEGSTFVYVINHAPGDQQVNKFLIDEKRNELALISSFRDPSSFGILNDLVVVEEDTFYITNYLYSEWAWEKSLGFHWGSVVLFENGQGRVLVPRLYLPNGINKSPDSKYIYVASIGEEAIRVFRRTEDNNLKDAQTFYCYTTLDNLDIEKSTGHIVSVGCPARHKLRHYMGNPHAALSPTQALKFSTKDGLITGMEQIYMNDGSEFSGGSVGSIYQDRLLMGSIATDLIICNLK